MRDFEGSANGISFIQGIMPIDLKITPNTTGIQIRYNNTRGISLDMSTTSNQMYKFDSAFFDFSLSALGNRHQLSGAISTGALGLIRNTWIRALRLSATYNK